MPANLQNETRVVALLAVVIFFMMVGWTMITPNLPLYARGFGASEGLIGALISGYGVARVVLDLPSGLFAERYGPKRTLSFGLGIVASAAMVCGLAPSYHVLFVGKFLEGMGSALYITSAFTILGEATTSSTRGRSLSLYSGSLLLGAVVGPGLGGFIADLWGLAMPFFVYALLMVVSVILVVTKLPKRFSSPSTAEVGHKLSLQNLRLLLSDRAYLAVNLATFSIFFTRSGVVSTVLPIFAHDNLMISQSMLGGALTLMAVSDLAILLPSGSLSDRYGRKPLMLLCLITSAIAIFMMPRVSTLEELWLIVAAYGMARGFSGPLVAWTADLTPPHLMGTSMGLYRMINDLGFVAGPLLLGFLAEASKTDVIQPLPFEVAALVLLLGSLGLIKARDPVREHRVRRA